MNGRMNEMIKKQIMLQHTKASRAAHLGMSGIYIKSLILFSVQSSTELLSRLPKLKPFLLQKDVCPM